MTDPMQFGATQLSPEQFGGTLDVDDESGAPIRVRTSVGAARTPQDKLSTLQKYYKDATPWGVDNFIYTDPSSGVKTLYNPKGLDMGDIASSARMISEFLGGSVGGSAALLAGQLGPQVATPEEIYTVPMAYGLGAAAGGEMFDVMADYFTPTVETRTTIQQAADLSYDVLANAVGTRAGELVEKGAKTALSKGAKLARKTGDQIKYAFKEIGAKPTAGAVSGSPTLQGIEQALSKLPASSEVIGSKYTQILDDMAKYSDDIVRGVSAKEGRESVGMGVKRGVQKYITQFKTKAGILYDKVDTYIQPTAKVQTNSFDAQLTKTLRQFGDDEEFAEILTTPLYKKLKIALDSSSKRGGMSYGTLKALRTKIGAALDDRQLIGDASQGELKQLYGALSDDITLAAANHSPEALKAAERASKFWAAGRSRIDDVLQPVANKKISQDIFQTIMSGSKSGAQKLRTFKRSLPKEDWDAIVAQQIREMGLAKSRYQDAAGEVFSPGTFLTNYNNLQKAGNQSAKVLFGGKKYKGLDKAIDNLVTVSASLKDAEKMANTSGTAQQLMYMQLLTGGGAAIGYQSGEDTSSALQGAALMGAAPWVAAKLITSPKFVNWLAGGAKVAVNKAGVGAHLGLLASIAEKDQDIAPAIYEYINTLKVDKNEQ